MTADPVLRPVNDDDEDHRPRPPQPKLFTRMITTRPAPPWDQGRQAALEARLGAPARLSEVAYRLQRLDSWRPGKAVRYAAVYVRAEEARQGLVATTQIGDEEITVRFTPPAERARRLRSAALVGLACAGGVAFLTVIAGTVAARRGEIADALETTQAVSAAKLREVGALRRLKRQAVALDAAGLRGQRLIDVVAGLAWASRSKAPGAHIEAFHWDHGFMAVEADGDTPPFDGTEQPMQRSSAPVRPGVWLWGVSSLDAWGDPAGRSRRRQGAAQ